MNPSYGFLAAMDSLGNIEWVRNTPGMHTSIVASADGGVFLAGTFSEASDFDPGPEVVELTPNLQGCECSSGGDYYLVKYDDSGKLNWIQNWRGMRTICYGPHLAGLSDGDLIMAGQVGNEMVINDNLDTSKAASRGNE